MAVHIVYNMLNDKRDRLISPTESKCHYEIGGWPIYMYYNSQSPFPGYPLHATTMVGEVVGGCCTDNLCHNERGKRAGDLV